MNGTTKSAPVPSAIALAQLGARRVPRFPGKYFLLGALLPRRGRHLACVGSSLAELDFGDPFERQAALGLWQSDIVPILTNELRPGECFCDCGAHIGVVSLLVAERLGRDGQVYAFEPDPETHARLQRNFALADGGCRLEAIASAVSDKCADEAEFLVSSQQGWSTLVPEAARVGEQMGAATHAVARVPVTTLDAFFLGAPGRRPPQAMKIDVEGSEPALLRGAAELLRTQPPRLLIIERNDAILASMQRDFSDVEQFLSPFGYVAEENLPTDVVYRHRP
jgi:FkbM family methyltransferase